MAINIVRPVSLMRFLREKLGDTHTEVPNITIMTLRAEAEGNPYRIEISSPKGHGTKYLPGSEGKGYALMVVEYHDKPNSATVNLTAYGEVPPAIQAMLDEFSTQHPNFEITVMLKEQ